MVARRRRGLSREGRVSARIWHTPVVLTPINVGCTVRDMQTYTTAGRPMPKTPASAKDRVRCLLTDLALRPPDFVFCIQTVATGRHLERVVVSLPHGSWDEGQAWFTKLCPALPWSCRVTLIPEVGRIEISPRGQ